MVMPFVLSAKHHRDEGLRSADLFGDFFLRQAGAEESNFYFEIHGRSATLLRYYSIWLTG